MQYNILERFAWAIYAKLLTLFLLFITAVPFYFLTWTGTRDGGRRVHTIPIISALL